MKKKILFASPPLAGHTNQLLVLAKEMRARGHEVTFATGFSFKDQIVSDCLNFEIWDPAATSLDPDTLTRFQGVWTLASRETSVLAGEALIYDALADVYKVMYEAFEPILNRVTPDLVVVDSAALPAMDLAFHHRIQCIVLAQFLGNHVPAPSGEPHFGTSFPRAMNPWQRLLNCIHPYRMFYYLAPPFKRLDKIREECGIGFERAELNSNTPMLVSTHFGIEIQRILPPHVQMIGPIFPHHPEELSGELKNWLDNEMSGNGVLYVSFGTLATLTAKQIEILATGLIATNLKMLWSIRLPQKPPLLQHPAFRIVPFVPQQGVLRHSSVKAFLSHCGMNSISESLFNGKPILGMPMFGDQHYNAARVADLGVGLRMNKDRFSATEVTEKILQLISDERYSRNAQKAAVTYRSHSGLETAVAILEDCLRRKLSGPPRLGANDPTNRFQH
jgi:MGT family glycosyltransferase